MRLIKVLTFSILITSCSEQNNLTPENMAESACSCFNGLDEGTIDERLDPCLSQPINENVEEIHKIYKPEEPIEVALQDYMMKVMILMVHNCDKYYYVLDSLYTNMYPLVDLSSIQDELLNVNDSIESILNETDKVSLLHKRITLLTKAREFEQALISIDELARISPTAETYWIKAYIFRGMGKYDQAIEEIDKTIDSGNKSSILYKELIKRKNGR